MKKPLKSVTLNYNDNTAVAILPGTITAEISMTLAGGQRLANRWRAEEKMNKRSTWFMLFTTEAEAKKECELWNKNHSDEIEVPK